THRARSLKPSLGLRLRPHVERLEDRTLLSFTPPVYYATDDSPRGLAAGDLNNDGALDLVIASATPGNSVNVLLGYGDGTFAPATRVPVGREPWAVAVGDFNLDGNLDVVVANRNDFNVRLLVGDGTGRLTMGGSFPTGREPNSIAVGDFNKDGCPDLAVANA